MKKIMTKWLYSSIFLIFPILSNAQENFKKDNLLAWCIIPYDSLKRGPEERVKMLKELGIQHYVYDWRAEHIPTFGNEIKTARQNNIKIEGIWLWIDEHYDKIGMLSANNRKVIEIAKANNLNCDFWVGFNQNFFDNLSHKEKVKKSSDFLKYLSISLKNSKIGLYNHGDWFGEPENQVEIIEKSKLINVGIVYSFHHGHQQINRFPSMLKNMLPYLLAINLNGMDSQKGQILSIGQGKYEKEMINTIIESGFSGKIGILGHVMNKDVKQVLVENLDGLNNILNIK